MVWRWGGRVWEPPPCLGTVQAGCKVGRMASGPVDRWGPEVNIYTVGDATVRLARSPDPVSGPRSRYWGLAVQQLLA